MLNLLPHCLSKSTSRERAVETYLFCFSSLNITLSFKQFFHPEGTVWDSLEIFQNLLKKYVLTLPFKTSTNVLTPCIFLDISWPTHIKKQELEQMIFISVSSIVKKVITLMVIPITVIYGWSLASQYTQKENVCKSIWMDWSLSVTGDTKL